jgi:hypothetical protein
MNIPKRISFFWSGGALSWMRYMTFWSFRLQNPDWEIHLYLATECQHKKTWTTGEVQDFDADGQPYAGQNYLPELTKLGVKVSPWIPPADCKSMSPVHLADVCRWGVLSKFGGWFADTDILWVDSMATRIETRYHSDAKAHEERHGPGSFRPPDVAWPICRDWLPTGLIGAMPETRFAGDCYLMARGSIDQRDKLHRRTRKLR